MTTDKDTILAFADSLMESVLNLEAINYEMGFEDAVNVPVDNKISMRENLREPVREAAAVIRELAKYASVSASWGSHEGKIALQKAAEQIGQL